MLKLFLPFLFLPLSNTVELSPYKDDILFRINWHPSSTKLSEIEVGPGQKLDASMCVYLKQKVNSKKGSYTNVAYFCTKNISDKISKYILLVSLSILKVFEYYRKTLKDLKFVLTIA